MGHPARWAGTAVALTALIASPSVAAGRPRTAADPARHRPTCPAAEVLAPRAVWHRHDLAPGVVLREGVAGDSRGRVAMHVLRIRLTSRHVRLAPLLGSLAQRSPLSRLAAGRRGLVAATNTGYFDFLTGAPLGALVIHRTPVVMSARPEKVVGIGDDGRAESGAARLSEHLVATGSRHGIAAVNELTPPDGISVYTARWGSRDVPRGRGSTRYVSQRGHTSALGRADHPHATGYLLVARGRPAQDWLRRVGTGTRLTVSGGIGTSMPRPLVQAYGVGDRIVARHGQVLTGFSCDGSNTRTPARTAIGYTDHRRTLLLVVVEDHPRTSTHGLDKDQMSELLVELGADRAYVLDGSGSSELLARMPGTSTLSLRTYPADGVERPMPVGLGVVTTGR